MIELLRSYRIAHARVSAIEPFETTLRENTPLTSINDPGALVEYLNQLNLKGDMVLEELKRVSAERASFQQKIVEATKSAKEAWDEVAKLREQKIANGDAVQKNGTTSTITSSQEPAQDETVNTPAKEELMAEQSLRSPPTSIKSRTPSIPGISLFSPKAKPIESPTANETSEEFFSYESELPRLESELNERNEEIADLHKEITGLKGDLAVARESTQSMVQTLEDATRELNHLRDRKDKYESEMAEQRQASDDRIKILQADLEAADGRVRQLEEQSSPGSKEQASERERLLQEARSELERLKGLSAEKEEAVTTASRLQAEVDSLRKGITNIQADRDTGLKRVSTLDGLLSKLREQLSQAEDNERTLKSEIEDGSIKIKSLQLKIVDLEKQSERSARNADSHPPSTPVFEQQSKSAVAANGETKSVGEPSVSKKKKKKQKKGGKASAEQESVPTPTEPESAATAPGEINLSAMPNETVAKLQGELINLRILLEEKDAAIDRLHNKVKNGEDMQEEIESLRDDLLHIGQEHVVAKDKVKELIAEKGALQKTVADLEKEIADLRVVHASSTTGSENAHKELVSQFEDLKTKATNLQTDLSVAQQLASSRFKDLTDLRTVLQKAQPELATLRTENGELKTIKEELTRKIADLHKIEAQHDSAQSKIVEFRQTVADRDNEINRLTKRLNEEVLTRQKAEDGSNKVSQDLQRLESEKRSASQSLDKVTRDLAQSRKDLSTTKARVLELEDSVAKLTRDGDALKEEIELKTAQYVSAESLMSSMRDQTSEMALQTKEARERCESLEEEVADAHRLLNERSREGETMRRLLAEVEGRADSRIREVKERMETAIEERDRAEDEASTVGRRRARELEELRNKLRDVERNLKRAEEDKEELDLAQRDWKKRREELEQKLEGSVREAEAVRKAMAELRDALDESERQARDLEKQKAELRRSVEETQHRLEKLQKNNKVRHKRDFRSASCPQLIHILHSQWQMKCVRYKQQRQEPSIRRHSHLVRLSTHPRPEARWDLQRHRTGVMPEQ